MNDIKSFGVISFRFTFSIFFSRFFILKNRIVSQRRRIPRESIPSRVCVCVSVFLSKIFFLFRTWQPPPVGFFLKCPFEKKKNHSFSHLSLSILMVIYIILGYYHTQYTFGSMLLVSVAIFLFYFFQMINIGRTYEGGSSCCVPESSAAAPDYVLPSSLFIRSLILPFHARLFVMDLG